MSERCVVSGKDGYVVHGYTYSDVNCFSHNLTNARLFETVQGAKQFIAARKRRSENPRYSQPEYLQWNLPVGEVFEIVMIEIRERTK